jgi:osmotically-inducible protein OsmY
MASDAELKEDVIAELRSEASLRCEKIGVRASLGVVTLTGYVARYAQKVRADLAVKRVPGVRALASEIAIRREGSVARHPRAAETESARPVGT